MMRDQGYFFAELKDILLILVDDEPSTMVFLHLQRIHQLPFKTFKRYFEGLSQQFASHRPRLPL